MKHQRVDHQRVRQMVRIGLTNWQIAHRLGLQQSTARAACRRARHLERSANALNNKPTTRATDNQDFL